MGTNLSGRAKPKGLSVELGKGKLEVRSVRSTETGRPRFGVFQCHRTSARLLRERSKGNDLIYGSREKAEACANYLSQFLVKACALCSGNLQVRVRNRWIDCPKCQKKGKK